MSRLPGDVNDPGSLPSGTFSILVFMVASLNVPVVVKVLVLEGDGENGARGIGCKNGEVATQDAAQSRSGEGNLMVFETTIRIIHI